MQQDEFTDIFVNGVQHKVAVGCSLEGLVNELFANNTTIVLELNGEIIKRENWQAVTLKQQDRLELLQFVGGG